MTAPLSLEEELSALLTLNLQSLRAFWAARYGDPPRHRSADLLRRQLAWAMQAEVYGGLDPEVKAALTEPEKKPSPAQAFEVGTVISREWQGRRHEILVTAQGFEHQGEVHASLSEVARKITGVRWNGPRFFGLRKP